MPASNKGKPIAPRPGSPGRVRIEQNPNIRNDGAPEPKMIKPPPAPPKKK